MWKQKHFVSRLMVSNEQNGNKQLTLSAFNVETLTSNSFSAIVKS